MITLPSIPCYLHPKQAVFRASAAHIRGFVGGRGCGKTFVGSIDNLLSARGGEHGMAVSPTYGDVEETTLPTFEDTARRLGVLKRVRRSAPPRVWYRTRDGGEAEMVFRSGEEPERLRGPTKSSLWIDEASVQHEDVFKIGLPILREGGRPGRLIMTFTPKGRRHWSYGTFFVRVGEEDVAREGTELIQAHTRENPFLPEGYFETIRGHYSAAMAAQELAGEFIELEGLLFRRHWFGLTDEIPQDATRARYWDKAATEGGGAYSCGLLMSRTERGQITVEDVIRGQWSFDQRNDIMLRTAEADYKKWGGTVVTYFEQEPGSGGKESAQQTIRLLSRFPVYRDIVSGSKYRVKDKQKLPGEAKVVRAQPFAAQCEAGNVRLKRAAWVPDYLDELTAFPEYAYADQVDASSGSFNKLAERTGFWNEPPQAMRPEPVDAGPRYGVHLERHKEQQGRDGRRELPWERHM